MWGGYSPRWSISVPRIQPFCFHCQKVGHFAKVWRRKPSSHNPRPTSAQALASMATIKHLIISNIRNVTANEPAPLVKVLVTSANGSCELQALPDSGADISAIGKETLQTLDEHVNSLVPSRVIPKAANGMKMCPLRKLPVKIQLGCYEHSEELHIYPNISGTLLSWKACKSLGILPDCYPNPITPKQQNINQITEHTKPCQSWNHPHLTTS